MPVVIRDYMDCEVSSEDKHEDHPCIAWSGLSGKVPVLLFYAETIVSKDGNIRSIGEQYNLAFKIVRTESRLVRSILTSHGFHEVHPNSNDFNLMWTGSHLKPYLLRSLQDFQKVNHFPRSYELTRKDRLYKNIQRMQQLHGFKHFHIVPKTFLLPCEYQDFCSWCLKDKGPWIVKPVASSRGRGIYLVSNPNQIPLDENILVSHYISDPLLIDDFKFDLRLYVLVTSYEPLIVYLYEEGLARFATVKYDRSAKNIKNQFMHLTNYSVNKKSSNYVSCDDPEVEDYGNKWSMSAMLRYLKQEGKDTTLLMAQVEDLVIKAVLSAELQIATACKMFVPHRNNCFELYGFDVLIDSNLKPWLLEVNLSPSLACDAPLDLKIKASMISDMFSLVGFVCQDPLLRQTRPGRGPPDSSSRSQARKPQCPFSAQPSTASTLRLRPMSANEVELNSLKDKLGNNEGNRTLGLTTEELKVLRRTMEEHKRRGGFIRIFPKPETWELYSGYLEYKTSMNCMLAARLFPERSRKSTAALKCGRSTLGSDAPAAADAFHVAQYERKLPSLEARKKKRRRADRRSALARRGTARRCEASNLETKEDEEDSREECDTEGEDVEDEKRDVAHPPAAKTASLGEDLQLDATSRAHGPKVNLLQILREGWDLSKVQARTTFSSYLQRVQMRLLMECRGSGGSAWPEQDDNQMELVIRFLKRATGNLQQEPRMVLPSRRLALADRCRILSYQLGEFIQFYHKETEQMVKKMEQLSEVERCINPDVFQEFVATASESDLEEVLTFYTRKNKSASVFLGTACRSARAEKGDPGRGRRAPADAPESVRAPRQPQTQASRPSATTPAALDCTRVQLHHDWPLVPPEPSQNLLSATEDSAAPTGELPRWGRPVFAPPSTVPVSSVPRAVQIYNQGISRPTSAHPASRKTSPSRPRPDSAVVAKELSPHQVPSPASPHHQAIAVALRRLAEKQATRQYAASSHISLLTQHLTNLNLASGACGSGGVTRNSSLLDTIATTGPLQAIRSESGFVCARKPWLEDDRMSEMDHRGPVTRSPQSWYKLQLATQQLWQQKEQAHQLLEQSRVRRQAILAAQATLPQGLSGATPTLPTALLTWQSQTPAPGASVLGPKPPSSTRDSLIRKTAMQRLNRPVPAEVWASASRGRHVVPEAVCRTAGLSMYRKPFQSQAPKNR